MPIHLDALFLPISIVGLSVTPVSVGHGGPVHPPVQYKRFN